LSEGNSTKGKKPKKLTQKMINMINKNRTKAEDIDGAAIFVYEDEETGVK